ncbi:hypothetical protein ACN38_g7000, partial [Penicillium nordicum]
LQSTIHFNQPSTSIIHFNHNQSNRGGLWLQDNRHYFYHYGAPTNNAIHPIQPGGSVVIDSNGTFLPSTEWAPAKVDTIYDMTSLTKVFTAVAALRAIDEGKLSLYKTVASYLPEFALNGKSNITVLVLLTHTCGFAPDPLLGLYEALYKTMQQRVRAII